MENSITQRIKQLMFEKNLKQTDLAVNIGITPQSVSAIMKGGGISSNVLMRICDKYQVNPEWLSLGKGDMYKNTVGAKSDNLNSEIGKEPTNELDFLRSMIQKFKEENAMLSTLLSQANKEKQQLLEVLTKQSGNLFSSLAQLKAVA